MNVGNKIRTLRKLLSPIILDTSVHGNQTVHWELLQQYGHDLILFAIVDPKSITKDRMNQDPDWVWS